MEPLQGCGAESHHDSTEDKEPDAAFEGNLFEDWIRVPVYSS